MINIVLPLAMIYTWYGYAYAATKRSMTGRDVGKLSFVIIYIIA